MTIQISQRGSSASSATIRNHTVAIDRPIEKGGSDEGPMGGELFLAAIGGCFMSTLLAAIMARGAAVSNVQIEVTAQPSGTPPRFMEIELAISADCADPDLFEKLVDVADRGCIMMNTLRDKLNLRVRSTSPVH